MQTVLTSDPSVPAQAIAQRINDQLDQDKPVLWLLSGGSAIIVAVAASLLIAPHPLLSITLADERYGAPGHPDSNYRQLLDAGFTLPITPVLTGAAEEREAANFARFLNVHLEDFIIGLVGMGSDGHTAGILPGSPATQPSNDLVYFYPSPPYLRITVTPHMLSQVCSAHLWAQGADKQSQLKALQHVSSPAMQPAQYLKRAQELLIYSSTPSV